jgi:hypothetical protein
MSDRAYGQLDYRCYPRPSARVQTPWQRAVLELDGVVQESRMTRLLLEPIYEQDFLNCSFGFRPGRSAHMAL